VERVLSGLHECSVLSICVSGGYVASGGSDRRVVVWDLEADRLVKVICDHEDSVLCVRFDEEKLVSCSKGKIIFSVSIENLLLLTDLFLVALDRTVRTYSFPDLVPQFVLGAHRAAVNAVSISKTLIISGSGDRSIRLWDAQTGKLLRTFENHHNRGYVRSPHHHTDVRRLTYFISPLNRIASIDFVTPIVVSGSSDRHLRLFNVTSSQGWSTSPDFVNSPSSVMMAPFLNSNGTVGPTTVCQACGNIITGAGQQQAGGSGIGNRAVIDRTRCVHADLVRSVALGEEFVLSGSYDLSIKVCVSSLHIRSFLCGLIDVFI